MEPMRDTLSALRDLEAAGIDSMHAEAIVGVVAKASEELVTKSDLAAALAKLEARIERAMNRNLLATIAVGGVIIAAVKLL